MKENLSKYVRYSQRAAHRDFLTLNAYVRQKNQKKIIHILLKREQNNRNKIKAEIN